MLKAKVVLIPFPFDDLSNSKIRPAVCLTDAIGPHQHVVLAFITSRVQPDPLPTDILIDARADDFAETGLLVSSTLRTHRLATMSISLIQRELGDLPLRLRAELDDRLKKLFELT